jgi:hypothetical protein
MAQRVLQVHLRLQKSSQPFPGNKLETRLSREYGSPGKPGCAESTMPTQVLARADINTSDFYWQVLIQLPEVSAVITPFGRKKKQGFHMPKATRRNSVQAMWLQSL